MAEDWEGCLSVPGLRGTVSRYQHIEYSGFTPTGEKITRRVSGFHARVIQHECDHLDGVLFPFKISDYSKFGFEDLVWDRIYGKKPQHLAAEQRANITNRSLMFR